MIEYSVCLPMFRAKYIAWLAFESLCRQKDVEFDWELIIAEEQTEEVFGRKNVFDYEDRLKQVGCHRIHYIPLQKWIPLAKKECLLFNNCSEESKYMRIQAADCYSSPHILAESYKILRNNPKIDWFECKPYIIFYDIETGTAKMVSSKGYVPSVKLKIAKGIKSSPIRRGCDTWFRKNYNSVCKKMFDRKIVSYTDNTQWKYTFFTHGFHNISVSREKHISGESNNKEWIDIPFNWKANIPSDIMERVDSLIKFLPNHTTGVKQL